MKLPLRIASIDVTRNTLAHVRDADGLRVVADAKLADAEFIVRACNAHERLVAALKAVRNEVGGTHPFSIHSNLPPEIVERIDAALTAAGAA